MAASSLTLDGFIGLSADTGAARSGEAHLRQSIRDILTTPIGSRVMLRDYGSRIPRLLDAPMTKGFVADVVAACADALIRWEPRITLKRVIVRVPAPGRVEIDLSVVINGRVVQLERAL